MGCIPFHLGKFCVHIKYTVNVMNIYKPKYRIQTIVIWNSSGHTETSAFLAQHRIIGAMNGQALLLIVRETGPIYK